MYIFNKITVTPQLPERIKKLPEIAGNLWWAWNTDFLKLFKRMDIVFGFFKSHFKSPIFFTDISTDYFKYLSHNTLGR